MPSPLRDVIKERRQRLNALIAQMMELHHQLLSELVVNRADGKRRRLVLEEISVCCRGKVELQVYMP